MNVLLIGGTGIISTGIVKSLKERGAKITVFNRGKTDDRLGDGIQHIQGDRKNHAEFERTMTSLPRFDVVMDMICFHPDEAASDLRAFTNRCGHFIFCSTVCTYGNTQTIVPTLESTRQNPHSTYGKNKLACEKLFQQAHEAGSMPVTIIRPSHTYGPGSGVINNLGFGSTFVERLRQGRPVIVSGDGHGLWQSAYSDDVGRGLRVRGGEFAVFWAGL